MISRKMRSGSVICVVSQVQVGEIYIVRAPFVGGGGSKPRPVLITGAPNSKGDVLGIPGSSRVGNWREPHQVVVAPTDLASGSLGAPTVLPPSKQMVFAPRLFAALGYRWGDFPEAERASREVLSLPMHPGLTEQEQEPVVAAIRAAVGDRA
jgi:hypothetical protein